MREIIDYYMSYCGNNRIMLIYLLSLFYLLLTGKENRVKLVYPSIIIMLVITNPVLYSLLYSKMLKNTYWRIMWLIPVLPIIGFAITYLIQNLKSYKGKMLFSGMFLILIMTMCQNIYLGKKQFQEASNWYKLPQSAIDVADLVLKLDDSVKCVVPNEIYCYIRQYSTDIKLLYGRNAVGYIESVYDKWDDYVVSIYNNMSSGNRDNNKFVAGVQYHNCNVVVDKKNDLDYINDLKEYGYIEVDRVNDYYIYYNSTIEDCMDNWYVVQYGYYGNPARMSYSLEQKDGGLIIVDGGFGVDAWMLEDVLERHNYCVDAWILTTPSEEHIGCFIELAKNTKLQIGNVYVADVDLDKYKSTTLDASCISLINDYQNVLEQQTSVIKMKSGDKYSIGNLLLECVYAGEKGSDNSTDPNMVFALSGVNRTILFIGDAGQGAESNINRFVKNQNVNYVEISGHDQCSFAFPECQWLEPQISFFDCSLDLQGQENVEKVINLGGIVYDFNTVPNWAILN